MAWLTMASRFNRAKLVAAFQTACVCAAVEAVIVLVLGAVLASYWGAAAVSVMILGPVSWWLAPVLYKRFLRTGT